MTIVLDKEAFRKVLSLCAVSIGAKMVETLRRRLKYNAVFLSLLRS